MDNFFELAGIDIGKVLYYGIRIGILIVIVIIAVSVLNFIFRRIKRIRSKNDKYSGHLIFLRYVLLAAIYITAILIAISAFPTFSGIVQSLLAGSGIVAIILGIACQEPIGNLASGMIILIARPFQVGDTVRYIDKDLVGVVEEISLRHTVIRTPENKRLIVPNGTINSSAIENYNYADKLSCQLLDFEITHNSNVGRAMAIISDVILLHPNYYDNRTEMEKTTGEPPVKVMVLKITPSSIIVRAWVWSTDFVVGAAMKSDLLFEIHNRFKAGEIVLAHQHMTVNIEE